MERLKRLISKVIMNDSYQIPQYVEAYIEDYRKANGYPQSMSIADSLESEITAESIPTSNTTDTKPIEVQLVGV